jgi:PAS domain-containing protein
MWSASAGGPALKVLLDEAGSVEGFHAELRRKDGEVLRTSVNAWAVRGVDGSLIRYEGIMEDVTQRTLAEEALRRSESELRALVESMSVTIMVVNVGKNGEGTLYRPGRSSLPQGRRRERA